MGVGGGGTVVVTTTTMAGRVVGGVVAGGAVVVVVGATVVVVGGAVAAEAVVSGVVVVLVAETAAGVVVDFGAGSLPVVGGTARSAAAAASAGSRVLSSGITAALTMETATRPATPQPHIGRRRYVCFHHRVEGGTGVSGTSGVAPIWGGSQLLIAVSELVEPAPTAVVVDHDAARTARINDRSPMALTETFSPMLVYRPDLG